MAKKSRKVSRVAPLQELTLVPITDPAKQAALEKRLERGREAVSPARTRGTDMPASLSPSQLIELARRLPAKQKRLLALTLLAEELSPDQQLTFVERFRARSAR